MKYLLILLVLFVSCDYHDEIRKAVIVQRGTCFDAIAPCKFLTMEGDTMIKDVFCERCIVGDTVITSFLFKNK